LLGDDLLVMIPSPHLLSMFIFLLMITVVYLFIYFVMYEFNLGTIYIL